jgi:DNA-binding SARP family transcriptional activator
MQVRPSGELAAAQGGVPVPVCGAKQRALLAILALQRGQPVSPDRLTDVLWDNGQATNPANALQAQIGQPRRTLGRPRSSPRKPAMPWPSIPMGSTSSA